MPLQQRFICIHSHRHGDSAFLVTATNATPEKVRKALIDSDPDTFEVDRDDEFLDVQLAEGEQDLGDLGDVAVEGSLPDADG